MPVSIKGTPFFSVPELVELNINSKQSIYNKISDGVFEATRRNGSNGAEVFVCYSSLPEKYKETIKERHGDPEATAQLEKVQPQAIDISQFWTLDAEERAEIDKLEIFDPADTSTPGKMLDLLTAAAVCRWYQEVKPSKTQDFGYEDKVSLQKAIHAHPRVHAIKGFYSANFRHFQRKFTDYKKLGIAGLVSGKAGNTNNLKLSTEAQKETLRRLFASHKNRDIVWVTDDYNKVAQLNGWPELSEGTIGDFLDKETKLQAVLFRNGVSQFKSDVLPTIHRERPSLPGYLWEGDGTPWELYYQYEKQVKGKRKTVYWGRKVVYVVTDAFNDLPLGWAIGDSENTALITAAWKNAILNTQMLPWQIRVDNFARKSMGKVYDQVAQYFTPTAVGNARAKLIEQMFGRFSATRILKEYPNWSGCNITNRLDSNQPNREFLDAEKKNFPDESGVIDQINESLNKFRNAIIKKDGLPRFDQWLTKVRETSKLRIADHKELIDIFGIYRDQINKAYTYQFTKEGLEMTINGETVNFMNWGDPNDPDSTAKAVQEYEELFGSEELRVKYLPEDLNVIRVDHPKRRKVYYLKADKKIPGCIMDMNESPDGRELLQQKLTFHEVLIGTLVRKHQRTIEVTDEALNTMGVDAEGILKSMFAVDGGNKQYMNQAKDTMKQLSAQIEEGDSYSESADMYDDEVPEPAPVFNQEEEDIYD